MGVLQLEVAGIPSEPQRNDRITSRGKIFPLA